MTRNPLLFAALCVAAFGSTAPATAATITNLASFNFPGGVFPWGGIVMDNAGTLYGETYEGGSSGDGTIFALNAGGTTIRTIASFNGSNGADPFNGLTADSAGNLYGTTVNGGSFGAGSVFKIAAGSSTITTVYSFNPGNSAPNGYAPEGRLYVDSANNVYGTTRSGGASGSGTTFEVNAVSQSLMTIADTPNVRSFLPYAGMVADSAGNYYGINCCGGNSGDGVIFEVMAGSSTMTTIASFSASDHLNGGSEGEAARTLIIDSAGNLFGTTAQGGSAGDGMVFEVTAGSGTVTILTNFDNANGNYPESNLVADSAGDLFGTTYEGGAYNLGTIFEVTGSGFVPAVVSEPGTMIAFGAGLFAIGIARRRRASLRSP